MFEEFHKHKPITQNASFFSCIPYFSNNIQKYFQLKNYFIHKLITRSRFFTHLTVHVNIKFCFSISFTFDEIAMHLNFNETNIFIRREY